MLHQPLYSLSSSHLSRGLIIWRLRNGDGTEGSGQWWPPLSTCCPSLQRAEKWKFRKKSNLAPQCLERSGEVKMQTRLLWSLSDQSLGGAGGWRSKYSWTRRCTSCGWRLWGSSGWWMFRFHPKYFQHISPAKLIFWNNKILYLNFRWRRGTQSWMWKGKYQSYWRYFLFHVRSAENYGSANR